MSHPAQQFLSGPVFQRAGDEGAPGVVLPPGAQAELLQVLEEPLVGRGRVEDAEVRSRHDEVFRRRLAAVAPRPALRLPLREDAREDRVDGHLAHHARLRGRLQELLLDVVAAGDEQLAQGQEAGLVVTEAPGRRFVDAHAAQEEHRVEHPAVLRDVPGGDELHGLLARVDGGMAPGQVLVPLLRQLAAAGGEDARRRADELLAQGVREHDTQDAVDVQDGARREIRLALLVLQRLERADGGEDVARPHVGQHQVLQVRHGVADAHLIVVDGGDAAGTALL
ncbi:hypothetical protein [Myxococcus sp. Y35]|uniref:hypothetical protein n=1 Tax=Pseudomyxococcus flavus TaxID=3115648 RepID=UPI003CFBB725